MKSKIILWLALLLSSPLPAQVLPPQSIVGGQSIADWTAEWWKWNYEGSTNQSPIFDATGQLATNNQGGPVFFVPGFLVSLLGTNISRHYAVPEDDYVLIPLLVIDVENIDTFPPLSVSELRDLAASVFSPPPDLHFSLDGVAVPNLLDHREMSPVFVLNFETADNLKTFFYGHPIVGTIDPVIGDGYWLMLQPLSPGIHVLEFGGSYNLPGGLAYERTDIITVVAVSLAERVQMLIASVQAAKLSPHRVRPLVATLEAARASFHRDNLRGATKLLRAFQNKVRAQIAREDPALAAQLVASAQRIIDRAASTRSRTPNNAEDKE